VRAESDFPGLVAKEMADPVLRESLGAMEASRAHMYKLAFDELDDAGALKARATAVRRRSIAGMADYLQQFERNVIANGGHVHWAADGSEVCETEVQVISFAPEATGGANWGHVRARGDGTTMRVPVYLEDATTVDYLYPEEDVTIGDCTLEAGAKYRLVITWIGPWRVSVSIQNTTIRGVSCTTSIPSSGGSSPPWKPVKGTTS